MAFEIDGNVGAFGDSDWLASIPVFTSDINFVSGTNRSVDVVLEGIVINVSTNLSFGYGEVGAFENNALSSIVVWTFIHEWEEVHLFVIEGFAVEWRVIVAALECNFAFNETIIIVEGAVLFKASGCTLETNGSTFNVHSILIDIVINTHR